MGRGRRILEVYASAIREERGMRAYLLGSIVDDIGIAVSAWGMKLLRTDLFRDQHARAQLMLPLLVSFLAGSIVAGPLADWARHGTPGELARWRWRLVAWARAIETFALSLAIVGVAGGHPTIGRVMPYFLVAAFMKTALRPTRIAFEVDLLRREQVQVDALGAPVLDERGEPRPYKVHLLSYRAIISFLRSAAAFGGLLLGGRILAAMHGSYVPLFVFDVVTNIGFIALIVYGCHPDRGQRPIRLGELFRDPESGAPGSVRSRASSAGRSIVVAGLREFAISVREAVGFLRRPEQRALCWLLFGAWIFEIVNEFYDGLMIMRHTLHGTADGVRHAEIAWAASEIAMLMLVPALARRVEHIGKLFVLIMFLDGVAIAAAGRVAMGGTAAQILPFAAVLAADRGLTTLGQSLVDVAQNSASSAAIRGRIAATYAFVVILSDMGAEAAATGLSDRFGLPGMVMRVGVVQVLLIVLVAIVGGRRLWSFGLRSTDRESLAPAPTASNAAAA